MQSAGTLLRFLGTLGGLLAGMLQSQPGWSRSPQEKAADGVLAARTVRVTEANNPFAAEMAREIEQAIKDQKVPGVIVSVERADRVLFKKAFGKRQLLPTPEPLSLDTIYDLASLTKPIATSTAIAILVEQGKLSYADKVAKHWPEFGQNGKDAVTIEQLLLHTSGLTADNALKDYEGTPAESISIIAKLKLESPAGGRSRYSDVGYIVLGELVRRASGEPLDRFCARTIFEPLQMNSTSFGVSGTGRARTAPTEMRKDEWMKGEVHDPRAFRLGGVAGHAGLFSTASDLSRFTRMVLHGGELDGKRILSRRMVEVWTMPRPVPDGWRTYGWDCDTGFSSNRGKAFYPRRGFGHTGFTGTSLWIEPDHNGFVLFLSNRVHPDGKGNVQGLRGQVATQAAYLMGLPKVPKPPVQTGLEVLQKTEFSRLEGKKIGLVTNHTGRDREGHSTIDLLKRARGVELRALFSPEHGLRGALDKPILDGVDPATSLPVHSLYGPRRKPTAEQVKGLDLLVFDIQDAGCRFYTYSSTLGLIMEAAAEAGIGVMVLDRPNPIGGVMFGGPLTDAGSESFVAFHRVPVRHGLTLGEMARLYAAERHGAGKKFPAVQLDVVPMSGWKREMRFDGTGLEWVAPSPNLRSVPAALNYPGIGLLELTNLSVGRGTDRPFEWIGAPWLEPHSVIKELQAMNLPGVRFVATTRTPTSSVFANQECRGIDIVVDQLNAVEPLRLGIGLALALRKVHPETWQVDKMEKLLCSKETLKAIKEGKELSAILASWERDREEFQKRREAVLLYR